MAGTPETGITPAPIISVPVSATASVGPPPPAAPPADPFFDLLVRLRAGDRQAAAEFMQEYGPTIRSRVRRKLPRQVRSLFDSQDILSTVSRRLDRFVRAGRFEATSTAGLWGLVYRMVDGVLIDKRRLVDRLRAVEGPESEFAQAWLRKIEHADRANTDGATLEIEAAFRSLPSPVDRQILSLWVRGIEHRVIADYTGLSVEAVRQRWCTIRERLRWLAEREAA